MLSTIRKFIGTIMDPSFEKAVVQLESGERVQNMFLRNNKIDPAAAGALSCSPSTDDSASALSVHRLTCLSYVCSQTRESAAGQYDTEGAEP